MTGRVTKIDKRLQFVFLSNGLRHDILLHHSEFHGDWALIRRGDLIEIDLDHETDEAKNARPAVIEQPGRVQMGKEVMLPEAR